MLRLNQLKLWSFLQTHLSEEINKKLLDQLYLYAKKSMPALLVLTGIVTFFMSDCVPGYLLYPWFFASLGIISNRIYDTYYYLKHDCSSKQYTKWYNRFAYKAFFTAFLWGSAPLIFLPYTESPSLYLFTSMLILGLSGGAMNSLSPDRRIATIYLMILLLPLGFYFLFQGTGIGTVSFFLIVLYLVILFSVNQNASISLIETYQKEEDLTQAKKALFSKQDELNSLFQQTPIGGFYFDLDLRIVDCNAALLKMLNSTSEELIGFDLNSMKDKRPLEVIKKSLIDGVQVYHGPYISLKGIELWIEAKCSPLMNNEGELIGGIVLLENKTKEKAANDELQYMARHDELTSLHNRRSFKEYMFSLANETLHKTHYSILFYLDLNQFKQINDSLGHGVGDQLLILVSHRLKALAGAENFLSRLGGDEFTMIIPFCATTDEEAHQVSERFAEKIQKLFTDAFMINELHLSIKSSIGIVIIEPGTTNIEELIRYADISMYQAKREGSKGFSYYNSELDDQRKALFQLQHELNQAIANGEFQLYYQPIVNIRDNTLRATEALLRWNHPSNVQMAPSTFIDLAIESGLIDDIGWWVIEHVCQQISEWKQQGKYHLKYVSINVNAKQLQRYGFIERFFEVLDQYRIKPNEIKLEITERSLIDNFQQTNDVIRELQDQGVKCAIDDFGTGYSSLSYLQRLSFSVLKIDREFIQDILINREDRFLVESIIMIAKRFGYHIVVEGIETEEQKELIQKMDPTISYQGYLFSPPLSAETLEENFLNLIKEK
ncbi:putative bifunctional diguanylate cyclase/phosphodiesterase [Sulfurovum mangrovi]|uniref:putative bifunctional diguanylate cyclase/phosphodiesterase n=1 Tax=Sulfurovum mangrovi TaxID=2893889 RepID=UPI001E57C422|nr:EAL domain-containing protein [Sulfurovum mangrovi]UFH60284.1 EAL domain-containing protein [Sulfurovum mangrovi]